MNGDETLKKQESHEFIHGSVNILILPLPSHYQQFLSEVLIKAMHESFTSINGEKESI